MKRASVFTQYWKMAFEDCLIVGEVHKHYVPAIVMFYVIVYPIFVICVAFGKGRQSSEQDSET